MSALSPRLCLSPRLKHIYIYTCSVAPRGRFPLKTGLRFSRLNIRQSVHRGFECVSSYVCFAGASQESESKKRQTVRDLMVD